MKMEKTFEFTGFFNNDGRKRNPKEYALGFQGSTEVVADSFTKALKKLRREFKAFRLVSYRVFTVLKEETACKRKFRVK